MSSSRPWRPADRWPVGASSRNKTLVGRLLDGDHCIALHRSLTGIAKLSPTEGPDAMETGPRCNQQFSMDAREFQPFMSIRARRRKGSLILPTYGERNRNHHMITILFQKIKIKNHTIPIYHNTKLGENGELSERYV